MPTEIAECPRDERCFYEDRIAALQTEALERESQLMYATDSVERIVQSAERKVSKSREKLQKIKTRNQFLEKAWTCSEAANRDLRAEVAALRSEVPGGDSEHCTIREQDNTELLHVVGVLEEANEELQRQVEVLQASGGRDDDSDEGRVEALKRENQALEAELANLGGQVAFWKDKHAICQKESQQLQRRFKDPSMPGMTPHPDFIERSEIEGLRREWDKELVGIRKDYENQIKDLQDQLRRGVGSTAVSDSLRDSDESERKKLMAMREDYEEQVAQLQGQLQQYQFVYHNPEDARALQREYFPDQPGVLFCR